MCGSSNGQSGGQCAPEPVRTRDFDLMRAIRSQGSVTVHRMVGVIIEVTGVGIGLNRLQKQTLIVAIQSGPEVGEEQLPRPIETLTGDALAWRLARARRRESDCFEAARDLGYPARKNH